MPKPWKEFENLVARIERVLAPAGALVKSNDRIVNYKTGRKRQVDATIRYRIGPTPCLIVIECRKHKRRQDDTWIEQLVTKRINLRADRLIAVSATPFTPQAIMSAEGSFVELRQISELSDSIIYTWLKIRTINYNQFMANLHSTAPEVYLNDGSETSHVLRDQFPEDVDPEKSAVYLHEATGNKINSLNLFQVCGPQLLREVRSLIPPPTFPLNIELKVQFPRGLFGMMTLSGKQDLHAATFVIELVLESTKAAPVDKFYQYSNPDGILVDVAESQADFQGASMVVAFHKEQGSDVIQTSMHIDTKKEEGSS